MKSNLLALALIPIALLLSACSKEKTESAKLELSPTPVHEEVEFCIIKSSGVDGFAGVVVTLPEKKISPDDTIITSNSFYGRENRMIARFLGSNGTQDLYEITTHFPGEPDRSQKIAYEGSKLVVRQFENIEMFLRSPNPTAEPDAGDNA